MSIDYPNLLNDQNQRWRESIRNRGLDPDTELEPEIRRSIERHRARNGQFVDCRTWLDKLLGRRLR